VGFIRCVQKVANDMVATPISSHDHVPMETRRVSIQTWKGLLVLHRQLPRLLSPWAVQPAVLDDALCRISPIPLELIDTWRLFDVILLARFEGTPGLERIKERHYMLQDAISREHIKRVEEFQCCFRPGRRIVMSALFTDQAIGDQSCPSCRARNDGSTDEEFHCGCGMIYQRIANFEGGGGGSNFLSSSSATLLSDNVSDFSRVRLAIPPRTAWNSEWWTCCQCGSAAIIAHSLMCSMCNHEACAECLETLK